jgi:hypothetical protein
MGKVIVGLGTSARSGEPEDRPSISPAQAKEEIGRRIRWLRQQIDTAEFALSHGKWAAAHNCFCAAEVEVRACVQETEGLQDAPK